MTADYVDVVVAALFGFTLGLWVAFYAVRL